MAELIYRTRTSGVVSPSTTKDGALTNLEIDANFFNLNADVALRLYEPSSSGLAVRTGAGTVAARSIAVSGTGLSISDANGVSGNPTITSNATSSNTNSTIVARDSSGSFSITGITASGTISAGTISGTTVSGTTGNITTVNATTLNGNLYLGTTQNITFEGTTLDDFETVLVAADPTADRTVTIPNVTGTIITTGDSGTVTNTMLAGSIGNSKLSNSSLTIDGTTISLGGTGSIAGNSITWTGTQTFRDNTFVITDNTDTSKVLNLELSSITPSTTRTLTIPDESGTVATQAYVTTQLATLVAPGLIAYFPASTPPTGWLKANGAAVSRTTYSNLYAAIGTAWGGGDGINTFNVPDLRGEFVRSWDDSKGVDTGRVFGSSQSAQTDSIATVESATTTSVTSMTIPDDGSYSSYISTGSSTGRGIRFKRNAVETRPRNIALLACIKF